MANVYTTLVIKHDALLTSKGVTDAIVRVASQKRGAIAGLTNLLAGLVGGAKKARVSLKVDNVTVGDRASTTATIGGTPVNTTDTIRIGDVTLTWVTAAANEDQITILGSNALNAAALALAINVHTQLAGIVYATVASAVVTIYSALPGRIGEMITLAEAGSSTTLAATALGGVTATNVSTVRDYVFGVV